jgi:hypothetical protein
MQALGIGLRAAMRRVCQWEELSLPAQHGQIFR